MKRRHFLSFMSTVIAGIITSATLNKETANPSFRGAQASNTDDEYILVGNWYLKKDDLKIN